MSSLLYFPLLLPLLTAFLSLATENPRLLRIINTAGALVASTAIALLLRDLLDQPELSVTFLYADAISAIPLLVVGSLGLLTVLFSGPYMEREYDEGHISAVSLSRYYALLQLFLFTMYFSLLAENLGLVWVAIEATTLASALLVAFLFNRSSLEAAWKYVMVCTVGICLALLGTILLYYAQVTAGNVGQALSWHALLEYRSRLDPAICKLAFLFLVIGYGTKAGLAPMHTWLPDAHSQAPTPISGLLSGALLTCALYALIRNLILFRSVLPAGYSEEFLLFFALFSIAIAVPFLLLQDDLKRLLAYSSVEHMGLITLGISLWHPSALYAAFLHMITHGLAKSTLFFLAGTAVQQHRTRYISRIRGLYATSPLLGGLLLLAILAIIGLPPFGPFFSKFALIAALFTSGSPFWGILTLLFLAAAFGGILHHTHRMLFGSPTRTQRQPIALRQLWPCAAALGLSLCGLYVPAWLDQLLRNAVHIATR